MTVQPGATLLDLLRSPHPDLALVIDAFVTRYNSAYGTAGSGRWEISKEDWQRFEFLGDRVLNLIVAQTLFTQRDAVLDEGEMTRMLSSVISNRGLASLTQRYGDAPIARLIPPVIGRQETYGPRIMGGAFEAFIGALYCEVGLDDVAFFVNALINDVLEAYDPDENAIGLLQEYYQKQGGDLPVYEEVSREGPDHKPSFTVTVRTADGGIFYGTGPALANAKQAAARKALERIRRRPQTDSA
jgi:ribonuclease-3